MTRRSPGGWRRVFGIPLVVGIAGILGLVSALVFEGPGRVAAWIGVGLPLALVVWFVGRAYGGRSASRSGSPRPG
ncbi:hypothetical protein [Methylobacterium oryzihabitans]|uniref:Uncharacterized protein n=1 Tax=Methylobacterium oryzihabitans TaxID=2499852 RepID=A0A437NZR9_9HYPH|nr:hypothetical protein [Methylobacterium oryzihabitans]RVU15467.1 hypothetical protein EOE48_19565 [Methylobacterium oryzihabitans]